MKDYLIWTLGPLWSGIACYQISKYLINRWRYPYQFKCKQCSFQFRTNIRETYEISKSSHVHIREIYDPTRGSQ